jgi:hypothetical protein
VEEKGEVCRVGTGIGLRGRWSMQIVRGEEGRACKPPDQASRGEQRGVERPMAGPGVESCGPESGPQGRPKRWPEMGRGGQACSGGGAL